MSDQARQSGRRDWERITEAIIGCAFRVANSLGTGFLERVYENALAHEIRKAGLVVAQQCGVDVLYDGVVVNQYAADLIVEDIVVIELKAAEGVDDADMAQCINYLRATRKPVCLLINFGTARIAVRRILNPNASAGWVEAAMEDAIDRDGGERQFAPVMAAPSASLRVHPCSSVANQA